MGMKVLALFSLIYTVYADVYLHNMRGSNNRLNGRNRERRNDNRLFDSQNNARGGYNVGKKMQYYAGSTLRIEWTNQHSCGGPTNNCEIILQYTCGCEMRDGTITSTVRDNPGSSLDIRYGTHESYNSYQECKNTKRNEGLFKADQNLKGSTAKYTRQNPGGTRRGFECPEERDYYPYWRHSDWKDIAIMTNNVSRCDYYRKESQNVKSRFKCVVPPGSKNIPINKDDCEKTYFNGIPGKWTEISAHSINPPDCFQSPENRINHNGNARGGETNHYDWTVPDDVHSNCVFRIRYNISTNDYDSWRTSNIANKDVPIHTNVGLSKDEAKNLGYVFGNNPTVKPLRVIKNGNNIADGLNLKLAINTAQFGRTFQDRSHVFAIIKRPSTIKPNGNIVNLNVRGKRGNIVQTYPATEYDFVPDTLNVKCEETYIHFQWTGADTNPHNNAGEGRRGTDRSNVCMLVGNLYPKEGDKSINATKHGHYGASKPANFSVKPNFLGLDDASVRSLCTSGSEGKGGPTLDNASPYYNHGLVTCRCDTKTTSSGVQVKIKGVWYYLSTRNNNFTNRSQKAKIICE